MPRRRVRRRRARGPRLRRSGSRRRVHRAARRGGAPPLPTARGTRSSSPASTARPPRCSWRRAGSTRSGSTTASSTSATTRPGASTSSASATTPAPGCRPGSRPRSQRATSLRIRVRYEHLAAEVGDDPDPYEPEPEEIDAVEEELRDVVEQMRAEVDFAGVHEPRCAAGAATAACAPTPRWRPNRAGPSRPTSTIPPAPRLR